MTSRPVESATAQELLDSFLAQVHLGIRMVVVGDVLSRHLQDLVTTQPVRPVIPGLVVHKQAIRLRTRG